MTSPKKIRPDAASRIMNNRPIGSAEVTSPMPERQKGRSAHVEQRAEIGRPGRRLKSLPQPVKNQREGDNHQPAPQDEQQHDRDRAIDGQKAQTQVVLA